MFEYILVAVIVAVAGAVAARRLFRSATGRGGCQCAARKNCTSKGVCPGDSAGPTGRDEA